MKLIYTNENRFLVNNARNIVENAGISVLLKNEFAAGGAGELPSFDTWLELWVTNDEDYPAARALLDTTMHTPGGTDWICNHCQEPNDASFEFCWNCQSDA